MIPLVEYFGGIAEGKIVACEKMKKTAERVLDDFYHPGKYHFDEKLANKPIEFIETLCKQPSGKIGSPLKLELFQKARLQVIFGFVDQNGNRRYNEVLIIEGRKNGKTSETSAVELFMLCADGEGAPQVYNIATMLDQAKLGFNACMKMMQQSPLLSKHLRKRTADIYFSKNMGYIKALASNTNSLDGLDIHCATIDELAAIKNRDLYDLIKQGMAARVQPLLFAISTNGFVRDGIFDAQYRYASDILEGKAENEHFISFINELDSIMEWDNEDCWAKANPGLDTIKSREYLRQMVQKAKDDPSFKPTVLVKDFNLIQTSASAWLRYEDLNNEAMIDVKTDYFIGGFDAADALDLNAATCLMARPGDPNVYVKSMFWLPQSVFDENDRNGIRRERDSVPYRLWEEQGYLRIVPGNHVDKNVIFEWFCELKEEEDLYPRFIGYDPWHISDELLRKFSSEFGKNCMIPVRQGVATLSEPMKELSAMLKAKQVVYDNNPILKWNLMNTEIRADVNGNIQPCKGRDNRRRIDGTAALLDAFTVFRANRDKYINLN